MVPPTVEALMDIMEGSRDLTELLDNEVAPDVVDQTRGLVEQVVKKVGRNYRTQLVKRLRASSVNCRFVVGFPDGGVK